jgi:hypothetical protein
MTRNTVRVAVKVDTTVVWEELGAAYWDARATGARRAKIVVRIFAEMSGMLVDCPIWVNWNALEMGCLYAGL